MKKLYSVAIVMGIAGVLTALAAVALDKSLPYRISLNEFSRYNWSIRLTVGSLVLGVFTLLCGVIIRKAWCPFVLGLFSLSPVLVTGGSHSGPNPEAWCALNLHHIEIAKGQLAFERGLTNGSVISMTEVMPFIPPNQKLVCAQGGTYIINPIGENARCTVHGTIR